MDFGDVGLEEVLDAESGEDPSAIVVRKGIELGGQESSPLAGGDVTGDAAGVSAIEARVYFRFRAGGFLLGELAELGVAVGEFALVKKSPGSPAE